MRSIAKLNCRADSISPLFLEDHITSKSLISQFQVSSISISLKHLSPFFLLSLIFIVFIGSGTQETPNDGYTLQINLPPEVVRDLTVAYSLPKGMVYESDSLRISGAATYALENIKGPNDGSQDSIITWNFGRVDNSAAQDLIIEFNAVVADFVSNRDGVTIGPGEASLAWKDADSETHTTSDQSKSVEIIEPALFVSQQFESDSALSGDSVTCTINLFHSASSHADAFNIWLTENIPHDLTYVPGSMEIVTGPTGGKDNSKAGEPIWHFDSVDQSWSEENKIILRYKATVDKKAKTDSVLTAASELTWSSAPADNPESRSYSASSESSLSFTSKPPVFNITLAGYPSTVSPGSELTYTISYRNRGGDALGAYVQASYDANTQFVSADPASDAGTTNRWTLGEDGQLLGNASGTIKVTLRVDSSLPDSTLLAGSATISSQQGASAQDTVFTKVLTSTPSLFIEKTASDEVIRPGGTLDYEISYQNAGNDAATNVTITDVVDANLQFDPANCNPLPSKIWQESDGTHIWWNSSILNSETMQPGDSGVIDIQVSLPSVPQHPDYDWVYNNYKIDSDESQGKFKTLQTAVIHSLYIRKKVGEQVYATGEMVNYTLTYGNDLVVDLDNAKIVDILPDAKYMEYVEADPAPSSIQNNTLIWNIGSIPSKSSGIIHLYAKTVYNRSTIKFLSSGKVSGQGYVNFDQRLDTAEEPHRLANYANITARVADDPTITESDLSSAAIILSESFGTALDIIGHGSGTYSRDEESLLRSRNKTIQAKTDLTERYHETSFSLPGGRSISYSSKWSEAQRAKNWVTGSTMVERYMYAERIDRESKILLDKNGSTLESQTSFEGAGHLGLLKQPGENITRLYVVEGSAHNRAAPTYESQEDYLGSFNVTTKFDEYGKNVETSRSVSGIGYAASDKRIGKSQRSYESGTGSYNTEDLVQTASNYLAKDINISYGAMRYNYTPNTNVQLPQKWSEGMWTSSGDYHPGSSKIWATNGTTTKPYSFIGEKFMSADYLNKSTVASGLGQMKTAADFQGKAEFKVEMNNYSSNSSQPDIAFYEEYTGKYSLTRNIELGIARFNEPHLSLSKIGKTEPAGGTFIDYVITVTNDGNRALGPVYVRDLFPPGTEYVSSSLRPTDLNADSAKWTLLSLGIGASSTIELKLNMTEDANSLINRVLADGSYDGQFVTAENYSAIQMNWLSCCPPQLLAIKEGHIDSGDDKLVHYRIALKNREKETMVATITDQLPAGMMFQNSSLTPSDYRSDRISWNIVDIEPGQMRTIDYWARALQDGVFVNQAHIETQYLNGTDSAWADVSCRVDVGGSIDYSSSSDWHPPTCFGLNYTQQGTAGEWIPCPDCGNNEFPSIESMCSPCTPNSESGYDIP